MSAVHAHLPKPHDPFVDLVPAQGIKLTPRHYAYLKISEGCNHRCTFCIIPSMRGDLVSRPIGEVLAEAERLLQGRRQGTARHLAGHERLRRRRQVPHGILAGPTGEDADDRSRGRARRTRPGARRVGASALRLSLSARRRCDPADDGRSGAGGLLPYLDVPFQHASPRILKLMKRPANAEGTLRRIEAWRAARPDLAIRSTFIAGFPGETEREFEELLAFLEAAQLDRVGCFAYSPVDGAAANALPDPVPEQIKEERRARFMAVAGTDQRGTARAPRRPDDHRAGRRVTKARPRSPAALPTRRRSTARYASQGGKLAVGAFARVTITGATEHDLAAVVPR